MLTVNDLWQEIKPKTQTDSFVSLVKRDLIPSIGKSNLIKIAKNYAITKFTLYDADAVIPPFTPTALIKEITDRLVGNVDFSTAKFLVIYTVEWANYLHAIHGVPAENITLVGDSKRLDVGAHAGYNIVMDSDFLSDKFNQGKDLKFDVVVGNPPFQKTFNGERRAKRYNLWSEFLSVAMSITDKVNFIIPDGWMSSGTSIFEDMKSFGIKSANIEDCGSYFSGVAVRFTSIELVKGHTGETEITNRGRTFGVNLSKLGIITPDPMVWGILEKLTESPSKMGWRRGQGYHTSVDMSVLSQTGKYEVVHTNAQTFYTDEYRGDQGKKKIISTLSGWFRPRYDIVGDLGACQATAVLEIDDPDKAKSVFESKLFKVFFDNIAKQQGWINLTVLKMLGDIDFSRVWTDPDLYQHFNLTQDEIDYIETNAK